MNKNAGQFPTSQTIILRYKSVNCRYFIGKNIQKNFANSKYGTLKSKRMSNREIITFVVIVIFC